MSGGPSLAVAGVGVEGAVMVLSVSVSAELLAVILWLGTERN